MANPNPYLARAYRRAYYRKHSAKERAATAKWQRDHIDRHRANHASVMRSRLAEFRRLVGTVCEHCGKPSTRAFPRISDGMRVANAAGLARRRWPLIAGAMIPLCEACARVEYGRRRRRAIKHGTRGGYENAHCRCVACTAANARKMLAYRIRTASRLAHIHE